MAVRVHRGGSHRVDRTTGGPFPMNSDPPQRPPGARRLTSAVCPHNRYRPGVTRHRKRRAAAPRKRHGADPGACCVECWADPAAELRQGSGMRAGVLRPVGWCPGRRGRPGQPAVGLRRVGRRRSSVPRCWPSRTTSRWSCSAFSPSAAVSTYASCPWSSCPGRPAFDLPGGG